MRPPAPGLSYFYAGRVTTAITSGQRGFLCDGLTWHRLDDWLPIRHNEGRGVT